MNRQQMLSKVEEIIRLTLKQPEVCIFEQTTASDIPGWDSLSHMTVMVAIEAHFNMKFSFMEMIAMSDIGSLLDTISSKQ